MIISDLQHVLAGYASGNNTSGENRTRVIYLEDRDNDHYTTLAM